MNLYFSFLSVLIVSLFSLIGVITISFREDLIKKYIFLFISLATGALLGDAFIHLLPEGLEKIPNSTVFSLMVISGIIIFFIVEKYMHWHHHYESEDLKNAIHPAGKMIILTDGLHNLIDGLIIGSSYMVGLELGIATTIAVILHEIPQEIGDFGVLIHSGFSRVKALWFNFASALTAFIGLFISIILGNFSETVSVWLIPFTAGGFIYVALSDLVPELRKEPKGIHSLLQLVMIAVGVISMLLLLNLE